MGIQSQGFLSIRVQLPDFQFSALLIDFDTIFSPYTFSSTTQLKLSWSNPKSHLFPALYTTLSYPVIETFHQCEFLASSESDKSVTGF